MLTDGVCNLVTRRVSRISRSVFTHTRGRQNSQQGCVQQFVRLSDLIIVALSPNVSDSLEANNSSQHERAERDASLPGGGALGWYQPVH